MQIAEILKSLWRLYSNENGDFQACRCCIRDAKKQSSHQTGGMRRPGGGVRGGKPPQGTGGRTYPFIDAMYPLDTADLDAPRIPPGQSEGSTSVQALMHVT